MSKAATLTRFRHSCSRLQLVSNLQPANFNPRPDTLFYGEVWAHDQPSFLPHVDWSSAGPAQPVDAHSAILSNEIVSPCRHHTALLPWGGPCQVSPTFSVRKPMGSGSRARRAVGKAPRPRVRVALTTGRGGVHSAMVSAGRSMDPA